MESAAGEVMATSCLGSAFQIIEPADVATALLKNATITSACAISFVPKIVAVELSENSCVVRFPGNAKQWPSKSNVSD
jgi:hypothetical protein